MSHAELELRQIHHLWDGRVDLKRRVVGQGVVIWKVLLHRPRQINAEGFYGYSAQDVIHAAHAYVVDLALRGGDAP